MTAGNAFPADAMVAVIGAGAMGSGIAQVAAQAGHPVRLFDARTGAAESARHNIGATLEALAAKGRISTGTATQTRERIAVVDALADCVGAKLAVEAIVEDLDAKRVIFRELEAIVAADAILASNTSSLSITALAAGLKHPARVVGMHFFNPAPVMPLVEVVSGLTTDPAIAQTIQATAAAWGKFPVLAASTPGFIVNRCARPFYGEALRALSEGAADAATLDAVMREGGGFRMGPFELMDLIGLDVNFAVTKSVWDAYFHDPRYTPSVIQQELVAAGFLGRKNGRGFHRYGENAPKRDVATAPMQPRPVAVRTCGDLGLAAPLAHRLAAANVVIERAPANAAFPFGAISVGGGWLALTDGRTATARAAAAGVHDVALFDLALDYATCARVAMSRADTCADSVFDAAVGTLQAAGIAVSPLADVAGLIVMRTVAMLANEAADAVNQKIATARDVDLAMQKGVNYPLGPLAWAERIGVPRVREVLAHLGAACGDRYRVSPLLARSADGGRRLL